MPLTEFQRVLLADLAATRSPTSYLAGGTALHFAPNSTRFSRDVDLFHDAEAQVAAAFEKDSEILSSRGYSVDVVISQPGFLRAIVERDDSSTQIDWARDSAFRFMPVQRDDLGGYVLHPVDLATNKVLALAGREEPRDFVDILFIMDTILHLGACAWASVAKDPGYSPLSLLEQIKRRGKFRPEDFDRLDLTAPIDLVATKDKWRAALEDAERFMISRPPSEIGCLYYLASRDAFVEPDANQSLEEQGVVCHYGRPGGVLPRPAYQSPR
jgi:hypothetical protein